VSTGHFPLESIPVLYNRKRRFKKRNIDPPFRPSIYDIDIEANVASTTTCQLIDIEYQVDCICLDDQIEMEGPQYQHSLSHEQHSLSIEQTQY